MMTTNSILTNRTRKPVPSLYEADESKYVGPHRWQIQPWAKFVRRCWHAKAYQRWIDQACSQIQLKGIEHLDQLAGPCVFIANHTSHLDTLLVNAAMPPPIRENLYFGAAQDRWFVKGKKKLELKPWYQSLALGNFPIMRGGGAQALDYAHWLLAKDKHVFLFPEGTRAQGDELGEFKQGAAMLAQANGVPLVPLYLSGLQAIRPKGSLTINRGIAGVQILEPIQTDRETPVTEITAQARAALNQTHQLRTQKEGLLSALTDELLAA